ncbi:hypothetical protein [Mumia zhuanghuii]|uniref:hypothetical protein n=1 Tax=Mumia zhuanghuii TaxID=2585211 RepID=UPI0036393AD9
MSVLIGELSTRVVVALLIVLNLSLGTRQKMTARAGVDALAKIAVPQARVVALPVEAPERAQQAGQP